MKNLNYWQRLKQLKMISQKIRFERYKAIYMWKNLEDKAPNCGIETKTDDKYGRRVVIPKLKTFSKGLRKSSCHVHGARIFNSLPPALRNSRKCTVEDFKEKFDQYLCKIPDQTKIGDLVPFVVDTNTGIPSNSIVDHDRMMRRTGAQGTR